MNKKAVTLMKYVGKVQQDVGNDIVGKNCWMRDITMNVELMTTKLWDLAKNGQKCLCEMNNPVAPAPCIELM